MCRYTFSVATNCFHSISNQANSGASPSPHTQLSLGNPVVHYQLCHGKKYGDKCPNFVIVGYPDRSPEGRDFCEACSKLHDKLVSILIEDSGLPFCHLFLPLGEQQEFKDIILPGVIGQLEYPLRRRVNENQINHQRDGRDTLSCNIEYVQTLVAYLRESSNISYSVNAEGCRLFMMAFSQQINLISTGNILKNDQKLEDKQSAYTEMLKYCYDSFSSVDVLMQAKSWAFIAEEEEIRDYFSEKRTDPPRFWRLLEALRPERR